MVAPSPPSPRRGAVTLTWEGKPQPADLGSRLVTATTVTRLWRDLAQPDFENATALAATASMPATDWVHRVLWGDNLDAFAQLRNDPTVAAHGGVRLIYLDPPYDVGVTFRTQVAFGTDGVEANLVAYRDTWGTGQAGYANMLAACLEASWHLLADDGALFVQCDWRANAIVRLVADELFGPGGFRNEIVWRRAPNLGRAAASTQLGRVVDSIFVYTKTPGIALRGELPTKLTALPTDANGVPKGAHWDDERGAYYVVGPVGGYISATLERFADEGRLHTAAGRKPGVKYFLENIDGVWMRRQRIDTVWDDPEVRPLRHRPKREVWGYDTQKPEGLLERIIAWGSAPGDVVVDGFTGSGTMAVAASRLGRRWVAVDRSGWAAHLSSKRVLATGHGPVELSRVDDPAEPWATATARAWDARCHLVAMSGRDNSWYLADPSGTMPNSAKVNSDNATTDNAATDNATTDNATSPAPVREVVCVMAHVDAAALRAAGRLFGDRPITILTRSVDATGLAAAVARARTPIQVRWAPVEAGADQPRWAFGVAGIPTITRRRTAQGTRLTLTGWTTLGDDDPATLTRGQAVLTCDGAAVEVRHRRNGTSTARTLTRHWLDWIDAWAVADASDVVHWRSARTPAARTLDTTATVELAAGTVVVTDAFGRTCSWRWSSRGSQ